MYPPIFNYNKLRHPTTTHYFIITEFTFFLCFVHQVGDVDYEPHRHNIISAKIVVVVVALCGLPPPPPPPSHVCFACMKLGHSLNIFRRVQIMVFLSLVSDTTDRHQCHYDQHPISEPFSLSIYHFIHSAAEYHSR